MSFKRIGALLLALALSLGALSGCTLGQDTAVAATYNGGEVPAGVYIFNQVNALNDAYYQVQNPYGDLLSQSVEGVAVEQWVNEQALNATRRFVGAEVEAARLGVTLEETAVETLRQTLTTSWEEEGAQFEGYGISLDSAVAVAVNAQLSNQVFAKMYGEGGEKEVPEQEVRDYFAENYRRSAMLVLSNTMSSNNEPLEGDALTERQALIQSYLDRAAEGASVFELIVAEDERLHEQGSTHEHGPLVEAEQEVLVRRDNTSYPEGLRDAIFAAEEGKVLTYTDDDYTILYDVRDLMGDGTAFANAKDTLVGTMFGEQYRTDLLSAADAAGFALNDKAVKQFTVKKLVG